MLSKCFSIIYWIRCFIVWPFPENFYCTLFHLYIWTVGLDYYIHASFEERIIDCMLLLCGKFILSIFWIGALIKQSNQGLWVAAIDTVDSIQKSFHPENNRRNCLSKFFILSWILQTFIQDKLKPFLDFDSFENKAIPEYSVIIDNISEN